VTFDFRNPDYSNVFADRAERLQRIRADQSGELLKHLRAFYRDHPAQFIDDWGCTFDPRLVERGLPAVVPFRLFPKQREWCDWVVAKWRAQDPGLTEKSRDMGVSWLAVALSATLCLFYEGMAIGFGSRKEEYVDKLGSPKSLFWKGREFIKLLPPEFRPGWSPADAPHLRIAFPHTGSVITGEAGDNIGRGDRSSIYFVDEAAFIERPQLVEASLSQTTNCRIDVSTPKGMANPFAVKRHSWPADRIFIFDWRDDPRKDDAWYEKQVRDLDPVTLAQEVDRSYTASVVGIVIPQAWVQSAIDADRKLGFEVRGAKRGALDVADEGIDLNAFCAATGVRVDHVTGWTGKGDDIFGTVQKAFSFCDVLGIDGFEYDADGLGAGVRGDARVLNEERKRKIEVLPFRGSGEVVDKDKAIPTAAPRTEKKQPGEIVRLNGDYFENAKAQGWFELRARFQRTHRAVQMAANGEAWQDAYKPDDLIVLNSKMPELAKLTSELSQPTYTQSKSGKMMIDKTPDGARSPNLADAVMIRYAPRKRKGAYKIDAWTS
jgi:phage terminase large subunit